MERTVEKRFHTNLPHKAETTIELFNNYYLHFERKNGGKLSKFDMEVATLTPQPKLVQKRPYQWIIAALVALLSNIYFVNAMLSQNSTQALLTMIGVLVATLLLTGVFISLYRKQSQHMWVFSTRTAQYPLIEIPFTPKQSKEAKAFADYLQLMIEKTLERKEYPSETLFAGEMRMLRRLVKKQIVSDKLYNKARDHMLKSHNSAVGAS